MEEAVFRERPRSPLRRRDDKRTSIINNENLILKDMKKRACSYRKRRRKVKDERLSNHSHEEENVDSVVIRTSTRETDPLLDWEVVHTPISKPLWGSMLLRNFFRL